MGSFANRHRRRAPNLNGSGITRREALALAALGLATAPQFAFAAGPEGQLTWGIHVSLAPTWFDPAETPGVITPFMELYALHDAMVKPMPGAAADAEPCRIMVDLRGRPRPTTSCCARAQNFTMATR